MALIIPRTVMMKRVTVENGRVRMDVTTLDGAETYTLYSRMREAVMKRAYVGNIPFATTADELRAWFAPYKIEDVQLIKDHDTGRSKGFAFVEFVTEEDFEAALKTHNDTYLDERRIVVNDATKRRGAR